MRLTLVATKFANLFGVPVIDRLTLREGSTVTAARKIRGIIFSDGRSTPLQENGNSKVRYY
jgi:hypothetical protein